MMYQLSLIVVVTLALQTSGCGSRVQVEDARPAETQIVEVHNTSVPSTPPPKTIPVPVPTTSLNGLGQADQIVNKFFLNNEIDSNELTTFIKTIGTELTVDLLLNVSSIEEEKNPRLKQILNILTADFIENATNLEASHDTWTVLWQKLNSLKKLQARYDSILEFAATLEWLENIHRAFEKNLKQNTELAAYFLKALPQRSLDASWFKFRLFGKKKARELDATIHPEKAHITELSLLNQVLLARLRVHFADDENTFKNKLAQFCSLLEENGIAPIEIKSTGINSLPELLSKRGCHKIIYEGNNQEFPLDTLKIHQPLKIQMPFDSAVFVENMDMEIKSESFDGSFFQFSTTITPQAIEGLTLRTCGPKSALALPMFFGIKVKENNDIPKGIYFFAFNHIFRQAEPGFAHFDKPLEGYRSNKLAITVQDFLNSNIPSAITIPGKGQQGACPRKGGAADETNFSMRNTEYLFSSIESNTKEPTYFKQHYTVSEVYFILKYAEKDKFKDYEVYFEKNFYRTCLDESEFQRYLTESKALGSRESDVFKEHFAPYAIQYLHNLIDKYTLPEQERTTPVELPVNKITLQEGPLGPAGECGKTGEIINPEYRGFKNEDK